MPPARKTKATEPDTPAVVPNAPLYISAEYAASLGLNQDEAKARFADAAAVHAHVKANPWITRDELVKWANSALGGGNSVDRLNAAVALLAQTRLVFELA